MKFVCPKMKCEYNQQDKSKQRVCHCDDPCTTSSCGKMIYVYPEKNLRAYPGVELGSKVQDETYTIRVNVEKSINHFKDSFCIAKRKTTNEKTLHSDLLLAGISQLLAVVVADKINQLQYIRSLKSLITQDLSTLYKHYAYYSAPKSCSYQLFSLKFVLCTSLSLYAIRIANELNKFRNYLVIQFYYYIFALSNMIH